MAAPTRDDLARIAHAHLDEPDVERWLGLLRPAVHLVPVTGDDHVVARIGGIPDLPADTSWPQWPGRGPLTFIAEIDLAALAASGLDTGLTLPTEGRLLAFYFTDPEGFGHIVYSGDPETLPGSRLLHVTGTGPAREAAVELSARATLTWPGLEHFAHERAGLGRLPYAMLTALSEVHEAERGSDGYGHQVGGWARQVQGDVEYDAAEVRLGRADYDEAHQAEAVQWRPLLQIESDEEAGLEFGDLGVLYWLARTDGSTPFPTDDVAFTWQSG